MTADVTRRTVMLTGAVALTGDSISVPMEDAAASIESEVRALFEKQSAAMRAKDIDRLMSLYSPDIVYFDTVPPLQYVGASALRGRFLEWFAGWKGSMGLEVRDLNVLASGDIAVAHWLSRASGTLLTVILLDLLQAPPLVPHVGLCRRSRITRCRTIPTCACPRRHTIGCVMDA